MKKYILFILFAMLYCTSYAYIGPKKAKKKNTTNIVNLREACDAGTQQAVQKINNVRTTLLNSGDVWWNLSEGQYYVPQVPDGESPVSSIYAGAVWIGGYEPIEAGNDLLKIAANTYRNQNGTDFYPGPLDDNTGATEKEICEDWDRFFEVGGREIDKHRINFINYSSSGQDYPKDSIPDGVRYWPGIGNEEFADEYGFTLPAAGQGLGSFFDHPNSDLDKYDPENGDYPVIEVRGCEAFAQYPDEMFFWIYNDQGGGADHVSTQGAAIQMEVQVQAFAYKSNDELNDMTFQRYKLINRAQTVIKDCYFAMWVDGDLGCSSDDFIGCDTSRSMAILYNQDETDGEPGGCNCTGGVQTYCDDVPILGIDYFRGPLKPQIWNGDSSMLLDLPSPFVEPDTFVEIGMTSFVYTNRQGAGEHPPGTWDAETAEEHYRLLDGKWRDGLAITFGDNGYNIGSTDTVRYTLPGKPADNNSWSMCSANLGEGDRRTIQASGPFILKQGAVNELIIGVAWVPSQTYPCPELGDLNKADDLAQALFDNCFQTLDGPDGPDVDIVELDREIIMILTNDTILSNNQNEEYSEVDIFATDSIAKLLPDSAKSYKFEGYVVYQLINATATSDLNDISKARIIRQVDVNNGVETLYNWTSRPNPLPGGENKLIYTPEIATVGSDNNIRHSFKITQDAFDQGDSKLVNHSEYYFYVIAYGFNEYQEFDPFTGLGQRKPFISGRRTFGVVTAVPRPMVYDDLNTFYGDGPQITRLSGVGNQGSFLELEDDMYEKIISDDEESTVVYKSGSGPLDVKIVNPLDVKDAKFTFEIKGSFDNDGELEVSDNSKWVLTDQENGNVFSSYGSLNEVNERILREYGISINVSRVPDISDDPEEEMSGGFVGASIEYDDPIDNRWLAFVPAGGFPNLPSPAYNFINTGDQNLWDPTGEFSRTDGVNMMPLKLVNADSPLITPANRSNTSISALAQNQMSMGDLNNVDIVFTSDKNKWSRCVVIETSHSDFADAGYNAEGNADMWTLRRSKSISKNVDNDGNPQQEDGDEGYGWFPGYAIDVESGERLNIFYGENSTYGGEYSDIIGGEFGRDMIWNPNSTLVVPTPEEKDPSIWDLYTGGQHMIYVTRTEYDGGAKMYELLKPGSSNTKIRNATRTVTWTGIPLVVPGTELLSYADGLIPNRAVIKLRVDNAFGRELEFDKNVSFDVKSEDPVYEIEIRGKEATAVDATTIDEAMSNVNAVPNPYYGTSTYELGQNDARVKITNVPSAAVITIYSIDGRFITQFKRDARRTAVQRSTAGVNFTQEDASVVWNLKNGAGIPISSGVYLIHVLDEETGAQKTIKWFGINRKFDPSGL